MDTIALDQKVQAARRATQARRMLPPPAQRREIRREAGLSQEDLAFALGVNGTTLCRWESGERQPSDEHVVGYQQVLAHLSETAA